ncbi:hypothetical protein FJV41_05645 [Myxococcus llanfairpwllgwyngyllgogerychwyrndrobwllllantysiliogogogochensis]|uniref:Uncharacterized protein n=1 Tax=Myxococcus llanfairpwllgwyngyllgogerychwyrndrobwllllantysiliogogogochensis TaxID=2590453 RepID=A0A540X6R4_9BACT|nr:hypothetical protein FJV41_05645 [Myxococcus llanfairpwllgwyngyllgogerychwyrndrobwllllantysiliogogogochensis]
MQDFLNAHAAAHPEAAKPRLTRAKPAAPPPPAKPGTPSWMEDFGAKPRPAAPSPGTRREPSAPSASVPSKKPDWMSDFED